MSVFPKFHCPVAIINWDIAPEKGRVKNKNESRFYYTSTGLVLDGASFSFRDEVQQAQEAVDGLADVFLRDFSPCPLHRRLQLAERGERVRPPAFDHPLFRALYLS